MSLTYLNYNICNFCNVATDCSKHGYLINILKSKVITNCVLISGYSTVTFLTPYLGNTCVPFQHWACSKKCVLAIEGPAKKLQSEGSKKLDYDYSHYIAKSHKTDENVRKNKTKRNQCCIC